MKRYLKVSVLVDNKGSWFRRYLGMVKRTIEKYGHRYSFAGNPKALRRGDLLFILSCDKVLSKKQLSLHRNNIVIHESDLPKGRGWSPLTWQVESGRNSIPVTLFEAADRCDSGDYYIKDSIRLNGKEIIEEVREKQAKKTVEMIDKFLSKYPMKKIGQKGKPSHYRKRRPGDNELNIDKSIKEQFNKMRIADNERYPLHFKLKNKKYILKIYDDKR